MLLRNILPLFRNIPGWHTHRKIIIIESDDWGSIRMPSKEAFVRLKNQGVDLESGDYGRYSMNDTLANQNDLENLFDVISGVKDAYGKSCVFTALSVVANPDFMRIKESEFTNYYYEPFTKTLKAYYPNEKIFELWKEGFENDLFVPQFHGREHINVSVWMQALRSGQKSANLAFNEGMWGFVNGDPMEQKAENQAAFQVYHESDLEEHKKIIIDGLDLFESLFGYRATYFVPPNGIINNSLNRTLVENGIKFRSSANIQHESIGPNKTKKVINWLGKKDKSGLRYIIRNCFFEPSNTGKDWVDSCLSEIKHAFRWNKPAIISSHRVNYVGVHDVRNRDNSLKNLLLLLTSIKKNWPDIEFMSTDKFGESLNHN